MADKDMTFDVTVEISGRPMRCTIKKSSVGEAVEEAMERFGILHGELQEIQMRSDVISIRMEKQS